MKTFLLLILFSLISFPSYSKEHSSNPLKNEAQSCPVGDPFCTDMYIPRQGTSFEQLNFERVVDGDTFVASSRKIRIWGINTPEKDAPGYLAAGWLLQGLIKDGELACKLVDIDRYKREVMHCLIDGLDIGAMMVKSGMAKDYAKYSGGYHAQEQKQAMKEKRGLWKVSQ